MPSTVSTLFAAAGLTSAGVVGWGVPPRLDQPGAYIVASAEGPDHLVPERPAELSPESLAQLLDVRPELLLDGRRPTIADLGDRLAQCWLPDEPVLYIGLASTSVRTRVTAYYRTRLGARKPHAGGWFLKTLSDLDDLWVHVAPAADPAGAEDAMLRSFCSEVSGASRARLRDPDRPFPFANLEWPPGVRKRHGITGAREPRRR